MNYLSIFQMEKKGKKTLTNQKAPKITPYG